jgi:NAD(P)-dependent dehydrogenase (short-subunit alcohol dehydrogenase family)
MGMQSLAGRVAVITVAGAADALRVEGIDAAGIVADVADLTSMEALADEARRRFGAVHVLCNNAGVGSVAEGYLWEYDLNDWRWGIDVNILGVVHGINAFLPAMVDGGEEGHVITTSSGNGGIAPLASGAVYPLTKAAVVTLSESLHGHLRLAGAPIGVSVLFPGGGWLKTGIWDSWKHRPDEYAATRPRRTEHNSLERFEQRMAEAGKAIEFEPLENVAELALQGVRENRFWLFSPKDTHSGELARARAESIATRAAPDYLPDWSVISPIAR